MNKSDITEIFSTYKLFWLFLFKPSEIMKFAKKNKAWKFFLTVLTYFTINTLIFIALINYVNTKQFITKWTPLIVIMQCIAYIPVSLVPISFRNINKIEKFYLISKSAFVEVLIVYSTLLYLGFVFYFVFLVTELYFFYFNYLIYSILITFYFCVFFPYKISEYKRILSIILTFVCCLGINFFSTLAISKINFDKKAVLLDIIYQESIEKTSHVINYIEYCNSHQYLIIDLENSYLHSGDKKSFDQLNEQINLILQKKEDILSYKDKIIFNHNKKELLLLIGIIDSYEKIKRELNVYEYIPESFSDELNKNSSELKELIQQNNQIKKEIEDSCNVSGNKEKLIHIVERIKELEQFIKDSEQTRKQIEINIESVKEINYQQQIVNSKMDELNKQATETMNYWKKREKFLF